MPDKDIVEQARELLANVTPGPFALIAIQGDLRWRVVAVDGYGETRRLIAVMPLESDWPNSRNNGLLFARAPELLRALADEVERLRERFSVTCNNCGERYLGPKDETRHGYNVCNMERCED